MTSPWPSRGFGPIGKARMKRLMKSAWYQASLLPVCSTDATM